MTNRFGSRVGYLDYLAVPGVGIFEFFVPVTTNHFPSWGISVIFDLTFLAGVGNFTSIFLENVKSPPYAPPPEDRFWEKNSSEGIVNSEVQLNPTILNSFNSKSLLFRSNSFPAP